MTRRKGYYHYSRGRNSGMLLLLYYNVIFVFFISRIFPTTSSSSQQLLFVSAGEINDQHRHGNGDGSSSSILEGPNAYKEGQRLLNEKRYDEAALELWKSVLLHTQTPKSHTYDVQQAFQLFMQCYILQDKLVDGLTFVSLESFRRGQKGMGENYLQQALSIDPNHEGALLVQSEYGSSGGSNEDDDEKADYDEDGDEQQHQQQEELYADKTPEQLYELGSDAFARKDYEECADLFELSCQRSQHKLGPSCANAVYCRTNIIDWGFNGTQFSNDMDRVTKLTYKESKLYRYGTTTTKQQQKNSNGDNNNNNDNASTTPESSSSFVWQRATSVHPHMMLGYPINTTLKRYAAESASYMDEKMARVKIGPSSGNDIEGSSSSDGGGNVVIPPLPDDLPYDMNMYRERFVQEQSKIISDQQQQPNNYKIRVGFVGSGFNSKAVLYLSQDMFRFFDKSQFEIHIFSFGPPDNALFLEHGMRGVDWRERVQSNVDYFHDCQPFVKDHIQAARFIHSQNIHILIEWDGFARQGERAQGLFALRPAPIQILHQEYLGTSGALYVDYIFSDFISSPPETQNLYTEKIIYMPNHFFSKGHAYQAEVMKPTYDYQPRETPHVLGTGSPQENRCLASKTVGPKQPSFVFCNFNKFLKNNPQTVRSWVRILREVPNSMLCLLENPTEGIPYLRRFVHETAGTSKNNNDFESFEAADGDSLNERIQFLKWSRNPFDHQMRNKDFCNVMLDSFPYNGHTVAQDAFYGGVPIVTRSDGDDMCSRVTTSANNVLGLTDLNAYEGPKQYEDIAIELGTNATFYKRMRTKLIDTCLQRNPMHPYWDVARYVKNFEVGLKVAWERFLDGKPPDHIYIEETEQASKGTYDDEILAHPPEGRSIKS